MNADQRITVLGIYINGALYLAGAIAAGLVLGNAWAWKPALASAGVSFIAYAFQYLGNHRAGVRFALASQGLAVFAGLALLFG